jgi:hypothetical protein
MKILFMLNLALLFAISVYGQKERNSLEDKYK